MATPGFQGPFAGSGSSSATSSRSSQAPNPADSNYPPKQWRFVGWALVPAALGALTLLGLLLAALFPATWALFKETAFVKVTYGGLGALALGGVIAFLGVPSMSGQRAVVFWGLLAFAGGVALALPTVHDWLGLERSLAVVGSAALSWLALLAALSFLRTVARTFHRPLLFNLTSMLLWAHVVGLVFSVVAPGNPYGPAYLAIGLMGTTLVGGVIALWIAAWIVPKFAGAYDKPLGMPAVVAPGVMASMPPPTRLFSRHHGQWIWGLGLIGVLGLSFVAWARFGPVEHNTAWENEQQNRLRADVPAHHNAYFDLAAIGNIVLPVAWQQHWEAWRTHQTPPQAVPAAGVADWRDRTAQAQSLMRMARQRPFAQGHVTFVRDVHRPRFTGALDYVTGQFLATVSDPEAFRAAVQEAGLLIQALSCKSHQAEYAVAVDAVNRLRVAVEAHFTLAATTLTEDHLKLLDVVLVDIQRNVGSAEDAVVARLLDASDQREISGHSTLDRIQQVALAAQQSREMDRRIRLAQHVDQSREWTNEKWAAEFKNTRFVLGLTLWERFRRYVEDVEAEKQLGETLQTFRQARTVLMMTRVACRLESVRRATGRLPEKLEAVNGVNWPNVASISDDWATPAAPFLYEVFAPVGATGTTPDPKWLGYRLGSRGSFEKWLGFTAARAGNLGFEMLPLTAN